MRGEYALQEKIVRKREFKALKVKTKGFKFNRDEIYDELVDTI